MKIRISLFAVLFLLGWALFAQEDTATITGVVTDPSGGACAQRHGQSD